MTGLVASSHMLAHALRVGWFLGVSTEILCASQCLCSKESWDVVQEYGNSSHPRLEGPVSHVWLFAVLCITLLCDRSSNPVLFKLYPF